MLLCAPHGFQGLPGCGNGQLMRFTLAIMLLAACGDDNRPLDAAKPDDAAVHDSTDAPPDAAATVRTVDCTTNPPVATVTAMAGMYEPEATTIKVNQVVKFVTPSEHNVVPVFPDSDSGLSVGFNKTQGECLQFTATGPFNFKCAPHQFMGSITVNP